MARVARDAGAQAVSLVKKAVAYYKSNGIEKSLEEFSNAKGQFRDGEIYVFVYDLTGTMLAHPNNTLIGNNLTDVRYRNTFNGNSSIGDYASWGEPRTYGVRVGYSF